MNTKPIILFDIDKTLLDTPQFAAEGYRAIREVSGLSEEELTTLRTTYSKTLEKYTDFDPWEYIELIARQTQTEKQVLEEAFFQAEFFLNSVFPDVVPVLSNLKSEYRLGLFTEGVIPWQAYKMHVTKLMPFFEPELRYLKRRKTTTDFLKSLPECTIVDDNNEVIEELEKLTSVSVIQIDRYNRDRLSGKICIRKLEELYERL